MSETAATFPAVCQAKKALRQVIFIYIVSNLRLHEWP
jgi:hypothetical protein